MSMSTETLAGARPSVLISYSRKDRRWRERLETHLNGLGAEGALEVWSDHMIGAGEDWYVRIENAIEGATVAILLVSADFLASRFILEAEIPRLLQRRRHEGLRVFPVICRPCVWRRVGWLASMQVRPEDGRPLSDRTVSQSDAELVKLVEEIYEPVGTWQV